MEIKEHTMSFKKQHSTYVYQSQSKAQKIF